MAVRVYADTNFLMALFIKEHTFHKTATKILKRPYTFLFNMFSLEEAVYALKRDYHLNYLDLTKFVNHLLGQNELLFFEITDQLSLCQDLVETQERYKLKPRDALHYLIMKSNKIKHIASFDNDFIENKDVLKIKVLK